MPATAYPEWSPEELRAQREEAGYTQEQVAEKLARISERHGFEPPLHPGDRVVRKHEAGTPPPGLRYRRAYTFLYLPGHPAVTTRPPAAGEVPSPLRGTTHPTGQQGGNPTDRRHFASLAALALGAPAAGSLPELTSADRLAQLDRAASAAGAVTAAEGLLDTIVGDYLAVPPGTVSTRVAALQQFTDRVQAECILGPADTARLWKVAGIAAGLRGWLENNAGDTAAARLSLREAHRRGELIGDDQLMAWARLMQATVEKYAGNPAATERYALDGLRHTAKRSPQRARFLVEFIARAHALRGDTDSTEISLGEAHDIVTALSPEHHGPDANRMIVDEITTYNPTSFVSGTGHAYAILGRPDRFDEVTAHAYQEAEQDGTYLRLFFRTDEAIAALRSADPDPARAADLARGGLAVADSFQTAHASSRLSLILEAAKPLETHPAIVDLAEYSAAWRSNRLAHPTIEA